MKQPARTLQRLAELGLQLPNDWRPRGLFAPARISGDLVFLSGQICECDGKVVLEGPVGDHTTTLAARDAARVCLLNLLYRLQEVCGDLDRVAQIVRVGGYVNCIPGYPDAPKVIDGASELLIELYGEAGQHARTAIGVTGLPGNAAVEVDAIVRLAP
ncbi:MAG: RidA family protein [Hyphomicrobiales bacterium]|nr:RidA family protein [Hyphomicrobiales bacterium]